LPRVPTAITSLSAKNWTPIDSHEIEAENWALLTSIVATCKLNDVNPVAYIAETLEAIVASHP
jgi:hypothetical protein